ncbi:amidohydrolase family protein [Phenylobacterium sp.]|uniref:metal-dependent hydrolase family protein n=1 Tax=Phenylobacterium sp. TaxID=1871053 RepID=UPI0035B35EA3
MTSGTFTIRCARIFDGENILDDGRTNIVVSEGRVVDLCPPDRAPGEVIDRSRQFGLPGLIDAHFHAYSPSLKIAEIDVLPRTLLSQYGRAALEGALSRGFTTVRDAGGADEGLWTAQARGLFRGSRLYYAGKALAPTGGHGDFRGQFSGCACGCSYSGAISRVVDGEDEVRRAVRDELRAGAHHIKLFLSGGLLSGGQRVETQQFSDREVLAAIQEAQGRGAYVLAHCHTTGSVERAARLGVRSVEHGSRISQSVATQIAEAGAFVVPTLVAFHVIREHGRDRGLPAAIIDGADELLEASKASIRQCRSAGVKVGLGTDIFDATLHPMQLMELSLRSEVDEPLDVLRSATSVNADLTDTHGGIGRLRVGDRADVVCVAEAAIDNRKRRLDFAGNLSLVMLEGAVVPSSRAGA